MLRKIGHGGFGVVVQALDRQLQREVAIKRLTSPGDLTSDQRARFEREARILARLDHPNVVPIYDASVDGDGPYIVMKLVKGRSLSERLAAEPPTAAEPLRILQQVTSGLAHAHSRDILHRDIKPSNVLEDEEGRIFLADFGLSTGTVDAQITQHGAMIGTLDYIAPEALAGDCTEQSDLYSLGALLYRILFGEPCFAADNIQALVFATVNETPRFLRHPPPETPPPWLDLLASLLDKEPSRRVQSAGEVQDRIESLLGADVTSSSQSTVASSAQALRSVSDRIEKLERHLEQLTRLTEKFPASLDELLESLSDFLSTGADLAQRLLRLANENPNEIEHAPALSLFYLSREIERLVETIDFDEDTGGSLKAQLMQVQLRIVTPVQEILRSSVEQQDEPPPAPDEFFTFSTVAAVETAPADTAWIDDLFSDKQLRRHQAALTLAGGGQEIFIGDLASRNEQGRDQLLGALWRVVDVVLLEARGRSRAIFDAALNLATNDELCQKWRTLYSLFQGLGEDYWDPVLVETTVRGQDEDDRRILGRSLLIHPWEVYRRIALEILQPRDFWIVIAHERVPISWLLELWRHLKPQVRDDYLKIFLACVQDRLQEPGSSSKQAVAKSEFIKELFLVDCFHESFFFKALTEIEEAVRADARRHGLLVNLDSEYISRIKSFYSTDKRRDEPVKSWGTVPLPVQRLLARRGHFQMHFACHPIDAIALECLPHMIRCGDVTAFLKLFSINARLLLELAKESRLFQDEHPRLLLVCNPKTPAYLIAKHINFLRNDSLQKLAHSHDYNQFAREYAQRLLDKRGRFRAKPGRSSD